MTGKDLDELGRWLQAWGDLTSELLSLSATAKSSWAVDKTLLTNGDVGESVIRLLLMTSAYHLQALGDLLLAGHDYPVAPYTLLRGSAESGARALWLMEPSLGVNERRERYFVERLANIAEQMRDPTERPLAIKRGLEVLSRAVHLGHQAAVGTTRSKASLKLKRPPMTELMGQLLNSPTDASGRTPGTMLYHYLSANAHSVPWALIRGMPTRPSAPGKQLMQLRLNDNDFRMAVSLTVRLHSMACDAAATMMGLNQSVLVNLKATVPRLSNPLP